MSTEPSTKAELRRRLLERRRARPSVERAEAAASLASRVSGLPEVTAAIVVATYLSTPEEPGTGPLLTGLLARGCRVLLPLLLDDFDLAWAPYAPDALRAGRFGLREPATQPLGVDGLSAASVVICPALAADPQGQRLGRGGGSYDRALSRLGIDVVRMVLLYDDEVLDAVPSDDHDQRVHVIVTPTRTLRTSSPQGR